MKSLTFKFIRLATIALSLHAHFAFATTDQECLNGVWEGQMGGRIVTMEFKNTDDEKDVMGRFYLDTELLDHVLRRNHPKSPGKWSESDPSGKYLGAPVLACAKQQLKLEWPGSGAGGKPRQILAEKAKPSVEYDQRRLPSVKFTVLKQAQFHGHAYQVVAVREHPVGKSIQFLGDTVAIKAVNQDLLSQTRRAIAQDTSCKFFTSQFNGERAEGSVSAIDTISAWHADFVTIDSEGGEACGAASVEAGSTSLTFDLRSGKRVVGRAWMTKPYTEQIALNSPLGQQLLQQYRNKLKNKADFCVNSEPKIGDYQPKKQGMVFKVVSDARNFECDMELPLPYKSLSPYLSPEGKAGAVRMQGA